MLKFSPANSKTKHLGDYPGILPWLGGGRKWYSLDLLAGYSCPFAKDCLAKVKIIDNKRKVVDGPDQKFRCFSASQEATYTNVYNLRSFNFNALRGLSAWAMFDLLKTNLPVDAGVVRPGVDGDFFSQRYFDSWLRLAYYRPDVLFYAYTKSLPYWVKNLRFIPDNFVLTASYGGRRDDLIAKYGLRSATVVKSEEHANELGLEIDHDDSHAADPTKRHDSFALLIHGIQPAGTEFAEAKKALKGKGSYGRGLASV